MTKKIVIIGAGFAGLKATRTLSKALKTDVEITLIDRHSYHTMMTQLHEVAAGRVPFTNAQYDLSRLLGKKKNVKLVTGEVTHIDKENKSVMTSNGQYDYDYVLVAMGAEPADFNVPGVKQNAYTLWSLEDALKIKRHLEEILLKASTELDDEKRKAMLNFSVAGSGFTGIEMMGELIEWRDVVARNWKIDPEDFTLNIVEMMPTILNTLDRKGADKAMKYMKKKGVNFLMNHAITEVAPDHIKAEISDSGEKKTSVTIPTHTLIWTAGVQGNTEAAEFKLQETERGHRLHANEYMEAVGFEDKGIYVAGDIAGFLGKDGQSQAQIVEAAEQTAHTAAMNIVADIKGGEKHKFDLKISGTMVSIGGRYGVAYLFDKVRLSGFFAMFMKNFIYLIYTLQIGSLWYFFTYLKNEFFHTPDDRNLFRGHTSRLGNVLWSVPLRIFYGFVWLLDSLPKVFGKEDVSWMTDQVRMSFIYTDQGGWIEKSADAATGASQSATETVSKFSLSYLDTFAMGTVTPAPTSDGVVGFIKPILKIMMPNEEVVLFMQKTMSIVEVLLGLALIFGLFTFVASAISAGLVVMFSMTGFFYWVNIWFIFVAIALMNGSGRSFGLDKWVQPWIQKRFFRFWYPKARSIYPGK